MRALCLFVLIGVCLPNHLLPQDSGAKNTPQVTAAGVTFATPAGWSVSSDQAAISVLSPEGDTHVVVLDEKAPNAATAVAQAWAKYKPGFSRPLRASVDIPDRDGWTAGKDFDYETSPNEKAVVAAIARRAGSRPQDRGDPGRCASTGRDPDLAGRFYRRRSAWRFPGSPPTINKWSPGSSAAP